MFLYPVTLKRDQDGGFVATFKDIPEAITQGETEAKALAAARDALETALDFYFEDNRAVPLPSKAKPYTPAATAAPIGTGPMMQYAASKARRKCDTWLSSFTLFSVTPES